MNRNTRRRCVRASLLTVATVCAAPFAGRALAQSAGGSTTLDSLQPSARARDGFAVANAAVDPHLAVSASLLVDYANDPLVYEADQGDPSSESRQIVHHHLVGHALFSIGLADRLQLSLGLPVNLVQSGDGSLPPGLARADGAGLGDVWLGGRVRLVGDSDSAYGVAAQLSLSLPTAHAAASGEHYSGDESPVLGGQVLGHYDIGIVRIAANLGFTVRNNQGYLGFQQQDQFTYGLGAQIRVADGDVVVHGELFGATAFKNFFDREATPLQLLGGAKWFHESGFFAGGGVGMGLVRGFGSPDVRALLQLGYTTPPEPEAPEEPPPPPPPADSDGDGLIDPDDACPNEAEDVDDFEDTNGCPDPDNDADQVLDVADGAPLQPEDRDGYQDDDGVPEPDNDGDQVLDAADLCPLDVGVPEFNGCEPPDRDHDTVIDPIDNCPDEAGTVENHGCQVRQQVVIAGDQLEIVDNVYFRTNRDVIEPRSFALLDNVAAVINAHPEIDHVDVEGHTDSRGNRERNVRLSQARAAAVVAYLVRRGVPESRLEAHGYGPDRPVVPDARTPDDHARNRRVEFHIADIPNRSSPPPGAAPPSSSDAPSPTPAPTPAPAATPEPSPFD